MKKILLSLIALCGFAAAQADSAPAFPGGEAALNDYIAANLKYPATAMRNGIEGVVNVEFMVQPDGSIGTIKIQRMVDPDLEQEAIRLVKNMPAWPPAEKGGAAVAEPVVVPVNFTLPEE